MRHLFPVLAIFCLAACGNNDAAPGPGGVSVGEARALDDAASMLDQQRLPPGAPASAAPASAAPAPPAARPSG
jgi:hypothetical protein